MKVFLSRLFIFFTVLIVSVIILFLAYSWVVISITKEFKLETDISELVVGDSHIQCALIDSLLENTINLGNSSESIYFTYFKLKRILTGNSNIKRVYLGFGFHSLSSYYDQLIKGSSCCWILPDYFYILPFKEQFNLLRYNRSDFSMLTRSIIKSGVKNIINNGYFTFAGYYSNDFTEVNALQLSMDKRLHFQYFSNNQLNSFSAINEFYLNEIIKLCKVYNIDLVLFTTPLHSYYRSKIPQEYIEKYYEIIQLHDLNIINLSNLDMDDSCYAPDGDHVSANGAYQTTKEFIRIIQELSN